jgi:hypothetical protein
VNVQRTCSEFALDDCKTANNNHFCYCNRQLCNGENAESIIEKYGDINEYGEAREDEESEDVDQEDGSGSDEDDEDFNYRSTSRKIDSTETTTIAVLSMSTTTAPTTNNEAVNSNLNRNLLIVLFVVRSFLVRHRS